MNSRCRGCAVWGPYKGTRTWCFKYGGEVVKDPHPKCKKAVTIRLTNRAGKGVHVPVKETLK